MSWPCCISLRCEVRQRQQYVNRERNPMGRTESAQRRVWMAAGGTFIALAVLAAGGGLWVWSHHWQIHRRTQLQTYEHQVRRISLNLGSGDIVLTPGTSTTLNVQRRLTWSSAAPVFREQWNGDTFQASDQCPSECSVIYALSLPPGVDVTAHTHRRQPGGRHRAALRSGTRPGGGRHHRGPARGEAATWPGLPGAGRCQRRQHPHPGAANANRHPPGHRPDLGRRHPRRFHLT